MGTCCGDVCGWVIWVDSGLMGVIIHVNMRSSRNLTEKFTCRVRSIEILDSVFLIRRDATIERSINISFGTLALSPSS